MKKQLLLMISVLSSSLTLSAQGIVEPNVYEQIYHVGNAGTPTEGQIQLTDYTVNGDNTVGNGYEQFDTPGDISFSLQSTADIADTSLTIQYRHSTGLVSDFTMEIDGQVISFDDISQSSQWFTELNGPGSFEFYVIDLPGTYSFTSGVAKNFKFTLGDANNPNGSNTRRRYYHVRVKNDAALSTTDNFITENGIQLYPNPATDSFELSSKIDVNNVKIFNVTGQLVKTLESLTNKYDISDLKSGLYLATINTDLGSGTIKLVKK